MGFGKPSSHIKLKKRNTTGPQLPSSSSAGSSIGSRCDGQSRDDAAMPAPQARMCAWLRAAASMIRSCAISKICWKNVAYVSVSIIGVLNFTSTRKLLRLKHGPQKEIRRQKRWGGHYKHQPCRSSQGMFCLHAHKLRTHPLAFRLSTPQCLAQYSTSAWSHGSI
jgi:hypothetical protein